MNHAVTSDPALTISIALAAGLVAQTIAHHIRVPGLVLLLITGALLGPDALGLVQPESLGHALHTLVGFAVAVILFEGGLNLDVGRLKRESRAIQRLITLGALITAVGATLAARAILQWEWRSSILFGTLVIVTGPTVVGPLVRRIRLKKHLQTVLEGEGVLIDPIGAIVAVVALDVALQPSATSLAMGVLGIVASLGVGCLLGFAGGWGIARLLRLEHFVPEGLENVFALSMILALFHVSNALQPESGIASVTIAGVLVGNTRTRVHRDLREFKEQLTVMLIGMLFVILAADVRFADLRALGTRGLWVVVVLMFVIRPINVIACTWGTGLSVKDKVFLSWIAPRGIVAAAVASFFALRLNDAQIEGGTTLRALVFLVIAVTVVLQGLTGGLVARMLGLRRATGRGWAILGANPLGLAVGKAVREHGEEVVFLDASGDATNAAQEEGFQVIFGNALKESTLLRAGVEDLGGCVGLTANEEVNLLFATKVRDEFKVKRSCAALNSRGGRVTPEMLEEADLQIAFGAPQDLALWESCVRRGFGEIQRWIREADEAETEGKGLIAEEQRENVLPLARVRGTRAEPVDDRTTPRRGDVFLFLVYREKAAEAAGWLRANGWKPPVEEPSPADEETETDAEVPTSGV